MCLSAMDFYQIFLAAKSFVNISVLPSDTVTLSSFKGSRTRRIENGAGGLVRKISAKNVSKYPEFQTS